MLRVACPVGFVRGIVHAREVLVIAHGRAMERLSPPLHDRGGVNSFMCGMVGSKWAGTGVVGCSRLVAAGQISLPNVGAINKQTFSRGTCWATALGKAGRSPTRLMMSDPELAAAS